MLEKVEEALKKKLQKKKNGKQAEAQTMHMQSECQGHHTQCPAMAAMGSTEATIMNQYLCGGKDVSTVPSSLTTRAVMVTPYLGDPCPSSQQPVHL